VSQARPAGSEYSAVAVVRHSVALARDKNSSDKPELPSYRVTVLDSVSQLPGTTGGAIVTALDCCNCQEELGM